MLGKATVVWRRAYARLISLAGGGMGVRGLRPRMKGRVYVGSHQAGLRGLVQGRGGERRGGFRVFIQIRKAEIRVYC